MVASGENSVLSAGNTASSGIVIFAAASANSESIQAERKKAGKKEE